MKKLDHVEAAKAEAIRLGATFTVQNGGKHLIGIICYNGKCRKTSLSYSPSRLACFKTVKYVRQLVRAMQD